MFALSLLAYSGSFGLGLVQDSRPIVTQDPRIRELTAGNLQLILQKNYWWPKTGDGLYRPVTTASFLFNYAVLGSGIKPQSYHLLNFLLHAVNVWLVYELALVLFGTGWPAFFAAALWAVHPITTEAVSNVVGRSDLLAAASVLGGLLLYIRSVQSARSQIGLAAALFVVATLGVFSKENAAVLLGLMLLWDIAFGFREQGTSLTRRLPFYGAVTASLLLLWWARRQVLGLAPFPVPVYVDNPLFVARLVPRIATAIKVIGMDIGLIFWPVSLSVDRSYDQISIVGGILSAGFLMLLAIAPIVVCVRRFNRDRVLFFAAGLFGIALLPTSNLIFPIGSIMAERFLYLPSAAFAIAVVALASRVTDRRLAFGALAVVTVLCAVRTFARNRDWQSDLTLATADLDTAPRSFRLHDMLAKALFDQDPVRNLDRAIEEQEKSWAILQLLPPELSSEFPPSYLGIFYGIKAAGLAEAHSPESRAWYEKSLAVLLRARQISAATEKAYVETQRAHRRPVTARSGFPQLYFNLANAYLNLGRPSDALEALRYGRALDPRAIEGYEGMMFAYAALGQTREAAVVVLEKALLDDFAPATVAALKDLYAPVPDAACAMDTSGGAWKVNTACPAVQHDLCAAAADLAQAFRDALQPEEAARIQASVAQKYACQTAGLH